MSNQGKTVLNNDSSTKLMCKWQERKAEKDNEIKISILGGTDAIGSLIFCVEGGLLNGCKELLEAKVFEIFGVYNISVAAEAISDCVSSTLIGVDLKSMKLEEGKLFLEKHCDNILSLFKEFRSKDAFELMLITKMIILHLISNKEFTRAGSVKMEDIISQRQNRAIKLTRLLLDCKDKLDKHQKPAQESYVQHNHIYNEGQAIIGSHLHTDGGR